jgi:hypothetical protein
VFNGSDLGKQYSAKGIQERCNQNDLSKQNEDPRHQHTTRQQGPENEHNHKVQKPFADILAASNISKAVDDLIQPTQECSYVPHQFKKSKKKKRKTVSNNL